MILCDSCSPRKQCTAEKNKTECRFYQPMTEQEYIQTCNTEQLAEFLSNIEEQYPCGALLKCDVTCGYHSQCRNDALETINYIKNYNLEKVLNKNIDDARKYLETILPINKNKNKNRQYRKRIKKQK